MKQSSNLIVLTCLESPFKPDLRVFEIGFQTRKTDLLVALFMEQFNTSKEIIHHLT